MMMKRGKDEERREDERVGDGRRRWRKSEREDGNSAGEEKVLNSKVLIR